jgi:hypothetical protein
MVNIKRLSPVFLLLFLLSCSPGITSESNAPIPTARPRPDFVLETAPSESQVLPVSLYEAQRSFPGLLADQWDDIDGYDSSVCLKVETGSLAQEGDDFRDDSDSTMKNRVTMIIDDMEAQATYVAGILLQRINVVDGDGQPVKMGVEPRLICSIVVLEPGVHEVLFQFRQTSGDILEYRWHFELTRS